MRAGDRSGEGESVSRGVPGSAEGCGERVERKIWGKALRV